MGKLVWLASYPKSGNTWLRVFLHNYILDTQAPHNLDQLMDLTTGEVSTAHYKRYSALPPREWTLEDVQRMRPRVHQDLMALSSNLVFVKTHNASLTVAGLPLITPHVTAGAIYIVRDPRDIALSYSPHLGLPLDQTVALMGDPQTMIAGNEKRVFEYLSSWSAHTYYWTRHQNPRLLVLRYEDLSADPFGQFGDVVRFLGQEPESQRLMRAIQNSAFSVCQAHEQAHGFQERPIESRESFFRQGQVGQWQTRLDPALCAQIEATHGAEMRRFGYF